MAHSFQIRCRILLAEFKVRMLKLERGAITAISNGGGRVAAATTVVIRSWIIRNIFVVSNFCDKILLIHVFWLRGFNLYFLRLAYHTLNIYIIVSLDVIELHLLEPLIHHTFPENEMIRTDCIILFFFVSEDISQDYIGRSLLWIQKILVNLISFCDMFKVWVTY
ncbi:unnamed protein product [Rhizophagus irregularis]|nr:unnamed protein product [Rhizophagus irregularis]